MRNWILTPFQITASIFLCLLFCASYGANASDLPQGDFKVMTETGKGRVVEIIDPLTIRLADNRLISLVGLDYPDLDYYAPGNFSIMTLKILKDFLVDQEVILYQTKAEGLGRINRMGHNIAHVVRRTDRVWTQGLMISLGLARVRTTKNNIDMADQMYALEEAARIAKNGLWAVKAYQIFDAASSDSAIGSYQIIEGEVTKTAMQKNRLYLNFGDDWRKDFTISISAANRRLFTAQDLDPQGWGGKKLRVRGWVESFNGPYIEVDHPQQFELLFLNDIVPQNTEEALAPMPEKEPEQEETEFEQKAKPRQTVIKRGSALPE